MNDGREARRRDILRVGGATLLSGLTMPVTWALAAPTANLGHVDIVNTAATTVPTLTELLRRLGYLEEFGVTGKWNSVSDGAKVIAALIGRSSDICPAAGFSGIFPAIENGAELKLIASTKPMTDTAVYSTRPDIRQVKDLVGRTIGTGAPNALNYQLMVILLRKKGINPKQVDFVNIGGNADIFKAVAAGKVDAGAASSDFNDELAKYGVHSLIDGNLWTEIPEYTDQAAYTSSYAIKTKRDVLVRVIAAYLKLYRYVQGPGSKEAFIRAHAVATGQNKPLEAESLWNFLQKTQPYTLDPVLSEERVHYMQALNVELGIQKKILPYEQVTDMSIAQDARQLAG